jgi:CRP/FNR family transcriptional regulator, cyclic AMP receptor protein
VTQTLTGISTPSAGATGPHTVAALLLDRGHRRAIPTGEVLFHEGDMTSRVYGCISGRVRLIVSASAGRELVLAVCGPGDVFGDVSALDGGDYTDAVRADPALALAALRSLAGRLRRANDRICAGETEPVAKRVARVLLDLAQRCPSPSGDGSVWIVSVNQTDLAEMLGATREATARVLADLRRAGVITTARSRTIVHDRDALVAHARRC